MLSPVFNAFSGRFVVNLPRTCLCPPEKRNQCFLHSYFRYNKLGSLFLPYPTDPTCNKRNDGNSDNNAFVKVPGTLQKLRNTVILILSFSCIYQPFVKTSKGGTSVAAQWLRIHLATQGTWVRSPVGELRSYVP